MPQSRRRAAASVLALALSAGALAAAGAFDPARAFPRADLMTIGVYYYPEHWPEADWPRDFANIAKMGFEFVHMAEFSWAFLEPREGTFDFAWLDRAVALAARNGLKVVLGTPTPCPPAWLATAHPEIFLEDGSYRRMEHGIRANTSTSSPVFRAYAEKIVRAMAAHYGGDPRVWGWQIDNEPYASMDHGPAAQARFREWLEAKYGTIDRLNEAWGTAFWSLRFGSFDEIRVPNRALAGEDRLNPHALLDHHRFNAAEMAGFLDLQARILRASARPEQWITTNYVSMVDDADPRLAKDLDFPAFTMYLLRGRNQLGPDGFRLGPPYRMPWANAYYRAIRGATGVMEVQPGQVNWARINAQPLPGAVRMWLWDAFGGGSAFACNYRFRHIPYGAEQYHDAMVGLDGVTVTPGGRQFMQVIAEMKRLRGLYDPKRPAAPARVTARRSAILWSHENLWDLAEQPQTVLWDTRAHATKYLAALASCGAPVDVVGEDARFEDYRVLVAPAYQLVDEALVARWKAYAERGGTLVLTCRTGQKDRTGRMWPGPFSAPIVPLAGAGVELYDMLLEDGNGTVALAGGGESAWRSWADVLGPHPGTGVWATYANQFYAGKAAVTARRLGKGRVVYVGVDSDDGAVERATIRRLFAEAGIGVEDFPEGVRVEWRDGFGVAVNYSSSAYGLELPAGAKILVGDANLEPADVCVWVED